jgi:hypothetical protein
MVTVEIQIKEIADDKLALWCEPDLRGCTETERVAAMILKAHVNQAFNVIISSSDQPAFAIEGKPAAKWRHKIFS